MSTLNWFILAYGTACAALAVFYCIENRRLNMQHAAFQAGLRVGMRTPMLYTPQDPDEAQAEFLRDMIDVSVDCHCP